MVMATPMLIWGGIVGLVRFCVVWDCSRERCGDLLESQCRCCLCCGAGIAAEIAFGGFPGIAVRCRVLRVCSVVVGIAVDRLVGISWNRSIVCCCLGFGAFVSLFVPSVIRVLMLA